MTRGADEPALVDRIVDELRDGEGVGEAEAGAFTLDLESAERKLRKISLPNPLHWVLLVLRGAVRAGATRVCSTEVDGRLRIELDRELALPEDRGGFVNAGAGQGPRGLRELVLGAFVGVAAGLDEVSIQSGTRRYVVTRDGVVDEQVDRGAGVTIEARGRLVPPVDGERAEQWVLRKRGRYLELDLEVGGERASFGRGADIDLDAGAATVEGSEAERASGRHTRAVTFGFVAQKRGEIRLLVDGVWVETLPRRRWKSGLVAVVSGELRLDAGQLHVVQDAGYEAAMERVEREARSARGSRDGMALMSRVHEDLAKGTEWTDRVVPGLFSYALAGMLIAPRSEKISYTWPGSALMVLVAVLASLMTFAVLKRLVLASHHEGRADRIRGKYPPHHPARHLARVLLAHDDIWPMQVYRITAGVGLVLAAGGVYVLATLTPPIPWPALAASSLTLAVGVIAAGVSRRVVENDIGPRPDLENLKSIAPWPWSA